MDCGPGTPAAVPTIKPGVEDMFLMRLDPSYLRLPMLCFFFFLWGKVCVKSADLSDMFCVLVSSLDGRSNIWAGFKHGVCV